MSIREIIGLILLAAAFTTAPFAYWLSIKWALAALALGVPGVWLYLSARVARKRHEEEIGASGVYPGNELRGFHGSDVFDQDD